MVGLLVRLRATLWRRSVTRSTPVLISTIIGALFSAGVLVVCVPGLILLRDQPARVTLLTVPLFTLLTLMWTVLSLAAFGVDQALDPARFAVLPVRPSELAPGMFCAAFLGLPAIVTTVLAVAQVGAWSAHLGTMLVALVGAALGVSTAIVLARVTSLALAGIMSSRRGREVGAVLVSLVTLTPMGLNALATSGPLGLDLSAFDASGSARAAGWTPVGWAWALPADVAAGAGTRAVVHLLLATGLVAALWVAWVALIGRTLTSPIVTGGGQRIGRGRLLPLLFGSGPASAVAMRRIRAWRRDSRLVSIAIRTAIIPMVLIAESVATHGRVGSGAIGAVALAIFSGLTLMNDLAFDGPAWWLHVSADVRGVDDRLGRVIASAFVFGPVTLVAYAASAILGLLDDPVLWLAVVLAALPCALGVAAFVGAFIPGTAPRTGGNPFAARSGGAAQGCVTALISMVVPVTLLLPVALFALLLRGAGDWRYVLPPVALGWGVAVCATGVVLGGLRLDSKGPEMLALLERAQV